MILDEHASAVPQALAPADLSPAEFFQLLEVGRSGAIQGAVFPGRGGGLTSHVWNRRDVAHGDWMANKVNARCPAYFTMGAYDPEKVSDHKGRATANVKALRGFWVDVEGSEEKGGYPGARAVLAAVKAFIKATGLMPNAVVSTGSGGVHLHYVSTEALEVSEWLPRARALVALAERQGFKIDAQCTTDAARIMRAPGSIHQKTGQPVTARRLHSEPYTLEAFDALVGFDAVAQPEHVTQQPRYDLSVNGDVIGSVRGLFSYARAAQQCGAMREAAQGNGAGTAYPVWILAIKAADLSTEGRGFAHQISSAHESYEAAETDQKLDSLTGGPAGCEAWGSAYGPGGPCKSCEYRGKIKNPAVQLGAIVDTSPPGEPVANGEAVVDWVAQLNARFALARVGSKMAVVDFETPVTTSKGMVRRMLGYLDAAGFHAMLNGRFAPLESPKDHPRALSSSWLSHPQRRQYEGVTFAPGDDLPADMLNTWQGFAVEAAPGDVGPWLEVLRALVPNEGERAYVLNWLAWKVQNAGGVPDTILIFRGAKGTGKNSLFDPLVAAFGKHAMLADDPELIAGRFTGHLMSLAFAVLDEAVFVGDPRQADRIKSRVTAKTMHYEQKGMDPVPGVNRCAYVMLTNHSHVWQATTDERRAVVIDVGEALRGNLEFWKGYHAWAEGRGVGSLLHYLRGVDLTGFNPRRIPKGEALRRQVELTALRDPAAAWWHQCLSEGVIQWRDGAAQLGDGDTEIERSGLRLSYEQSALARCRATNDWSAVARKLKEWTGPGGVVKTRKRSGTGREWVEVLAPLSTLRVAFTEKTQVQFDDVE